MQFLFIKLDKQALASYLEIQKKCPFVCVCDTFIDLNGISLTGSHAQNLS